MIYPDRTASGNLQLRHLGDPPKQVWDADGVLLVRHLISSEPSRPSPDLPQWGDEELPF